MIKKISSLVYKACHNKSNFFGPTIWDNHVLPVVEDAKILAQKLGADRQVVEISAWLHDYASIKNKSFYPEHHLHGARLAGVILKKMNYPEDKIDQVKKCIYSHRASKNIPRKSLEAKIVACADAMAHFKNVDKLLYFAYVKRKMDPEEGKKWVLEKLKRSYVKLLTPAKKMLKKKIEAIKIVFS
ncbi:metal-dependent phosphohydrolase [Candidatus Beckwithbacteria bacterium CG10_big_fil_rev_8_21_14_0_10_34_10]|uniref:Metal-dependent phosphohydrolase n=1 Tax=Candidatus Beckwithbacteria bacterium CG10_big_fil_rev_8_21_14_0_10_34_10 TaxID=1974495 RepID=A0A2H0W9E5_9BACT|nr:MAG: metal-dependent phosphohydrolase [Candidatus Beckwithbacteria bacterium CG10_big_fil_rev_8_21_14_0_10_34_10]